MDPSRLAVILLNGVVLKIANISYYLGEIELYYYSNAHPDQYVHRNSQQGRMGRLYFHQHGNGTYKGGTFKGMDLTFGSPEIQMTMLVRTLQSGSGKIITGPCNCVDHILELLQAPSILSLVNRIGDLNILEPNPYLYLSPFPVCTTDQIRTGPRVGLSDKYPIYKNLNYRYVSERVRKEIKKQKSSLIPFWGNF